RVRGMRVQITRVDVIFRSRFCLAGEYGRSQSNGSAQIRSEAAHAGPPQILSNNTTACDSAERPSPTGPTFSAVLNLTETISTGSPIVFASDSRIGSRQSFSFCRSRITVESTLTIR